MVEAAPNRDRAPSSFKDYMHKKYVKPWGYEYMCYQSETIGIWILHVNADQATSVHCHFRKATLLVCLHGAFRINLFADQYRILNEGDTLYIPANTFHGIQSYINDGVILEVELYNDGITYSDKNDLLRMKDMYVRDKTSYENSVQEQAHYPGVDFGSIGSQYRYGLSELHVLTLDMLLNSATSTNFYILLQGHLLQETKGHLMPGSLVDPKLPLVSLSETATHSMVLAFRNLFISERRKLIFSKQHLHDVLALSNKSPPLHRGLTSGCFDIMHTGHLSFLKQSKQQCDELFVCLSSDAQIKELKGQTRPVNQLQDRIHMLAALPFVDYVILYEETDSQQENELDTIMHIVQPTTWFKGTDYTIAGIRAKHPGLKCICLFENVVGQSTTSIIQRIIDGAQDHLKTHD
jgi:rfaE bifunctional protein nucleotidyltransferase chain/domain